MKTLLCEHCGEEFLSRDDERWNDDKAAAELAQNFPGTPVEACAIVCDDCYRRLMRQ